jgi:hypothetical protein
MGLPKWVAPAVGCPYSPTGMKTAKRLVRGASPTGEEKGCRAIASELAVTKYIDAMPLIFNRWELGLCLKYHCRIEAGDFLNRKDG